MARRRLGWRFKSPKFMIFPLIELITSGDDRQTNDLLGREKRFDLTTSYQMFRPHYTRIGFSRQEPPFHRDARPSSRPDPWMSREERGGTAVDYLAFLEDLGDGREDIGAVPRHDGFNALVLFARPHFLDRPPGLPVVEQEFLRRSAAEDFDPSWRSLNNACDLDSAGAFLNGIVNPHFPGPNRAATADDLSAKYPHGRPLETQPSVIIQDCAPEIPPERERLGSDPRG